MPMLDDCARDIHAGPSALPRAPAKVEVLDVSGLILLVDVAEHGELPGIVQRAAAAAVQNVTEILAGQRFITAHRKLGGPRRENGFAGLLAAHSGRKTNFGCAAEEV